MKKALLATALAAAFLGAGVMSAEARPCPYGDGPHKWHDGCPYYDTDDDSYEDGWYDADGYYHHRGYHHRDCCRR